MASAVSSIFPPIANTRIRSGGFNSSAGIAKQEAYTPQFSRSVRSNSRAGKGREKR